MSPAKRAPMPGPDEVTPSKSAAIDTWLDALLGKDVISKDPNFETLDRGGAVMATTTSTNPDKPRTRQAGYDYKTNTMTVVFRDGTWWEYRNVPVETWYEFKAAESKGRYLRESGLDSWGDMGPADISAMPRSRRAQMNQNSNIVKSLQSDKGSSEEG